MKKAVYILTNLDTLETLTLTHSPMGWDDSLVKVGRHDLYFGLLRSFTVPVKFVKEGAAFLRNAYYTKGIDARVQIEIENLNGLTLLYSDWHTGIIDFKTYKDFEKYTEANITEGGLSAIVKNNDEIVYEISMLEKGNVDWKLFDRTSVLPGPWGDSMKGITQFELAYWIIDAMTGGGLESETYAFKSDFLEAITLTPVITCGSCLVRDPMNIKTSLRDFFISVNAISGGGIGLGIEVIDGVETIVIEQKSYFFDNTTDILSFSQVNKVVVSSSKDHLFNVIKAGYSSEKVQFEESGDELSNWEPNTHADYKLPLENVKASLEIVSKYRGDYLRILDIYTNGPSTDRSENDIDEIFFVWLRSSMAGNYMLRGYSQIGVGGPTKFFGNMAITPKRIMMNHASLINSICDKQEGEFYYFITSGGNNNTITSVYDASDVSPEEIFEWGSVDIESTPKLFRPVIFEFEAVTKPSYNSVLAINGKGRISFSYLGNTYKGFLMELDASPVANKTTVVKLLCCPDTDLSTLIR